MSKYLTISHLTYHIINLGNSRIAQTPDYQQYVLITFKIKTPKGAKNELISG